MKHKALMILYHSIIILCIISISACSLVTKKGTERTTKGFFAYYDIPLYKVESGDYLKSNSNFGRITEDHNFYQTIYNDFYEDNFINILWRADSRNLLCYLMNKTDTPIKIFWNQSYFITDDLTDFISHSDVSQANIQKDQTFSVIPVGKSEFVEERIQPNKKFLKSIYMSKKGELSDYYPSMFGYRVEPLFIDFDDHVTTEGDFKKLKHFNKKMNENIGKTFRLIMNFEINNKHQVYVFHFKVDKINCEEQFLEKKVP
jgi:hypothetical protein